MKKMRYRLGLDLGSTSIGWSMIRLDSSNQPCAVIRAGSRIFPDGRNPKDGSSLAVTRRMARAMRRRRDRFLKRKTRLIRLLVEFGFFPREEADRKSLAALNPYELRAEGLTRPLTGPEFARALFHINQRRGFKSNRKTDKQDTDGSALKKAISALRESLARDNCQTVGEWLHKRQSAGLTVRARFRQSRVEREDGRARIEKSYDLYVDRSMVEAEFDALWSVQARLNPSLFNEGARATLKDCLLHQRPLKPVTPGRCTLLPDEPRAPLALPTSQRFRILQEVNNLRILTAELGERPLTRDQRDLVVDALEKNGRRTFTQLRKLLQLPGTTQFNLEDAKREELKGNQTNAAFSKPAHFGDAWFAFAEIQQDDIVERVLSTESEQELVNWLMSNFGLDEPNADAIANVGLVEGYASLSAKALKRIVPALRGDVITYDKAVLVAGFEHHSQLAASSTGEILPELPYYGEALQRHVGFGTGNPADPVEKQFGRIANPTVHVGLNQVRTVVNALIRRYGHPSEVIVEVARDLKQNQEQKKEDQERQASNQRRNQRLRREIAELLGGIPVDNVKAADIQKMILWEELSRDAADRRCPYSGIQISARMLLSDEVEIEHILPFSVTLDDSLNNKTVAMRRANRVKGNRTPWQARSDLESQGWSYDEMLARAEAMPRGKRYRFAPDGYERWLREDKDFLARALNDTRYLSRIAREYLSLICPQDTRVIPGQMTAMLRAKFGLNDILGLSGEKNRNDHRHHAVDACIIAVTDQGLLQAFASASGSARERQLGRLVDNMPLPWPSYREHVARAIEHIWVSHKPDHGHEGAMHNDTAYGLLDGERVRVHKMVDGTRVREEAALKVIPFTAPQAAGRHGVLEDGSPRPYKGYKGDSNYCMEIVRTPKGWSGEVVSTFEAYQAVRKGGKEALRQKTLSLSGKPLVMRLMINDTIRLEVDGRVRTMRVATISANGQIFMADTHEVNVDSRNRDRSDAFGYVSKMPGSLQKAKGRRVTVSPIGDVRDPGFPG
jgi:CRISPR-associated endonuclease Csn1